MGDGFFDFDELEAQLPFEGKCHHVKRWESLFSPLNTTTTTVTAQPILGGASFCGNLSAGLRVQLFGLSRGMLKLDVVITQVRPIPDSTGFIMCVSTAGSAAEVRAWKLDMVLWIGHWRNLWMAVPDSVTQVVASKLVRKHLTCAWGQHSANASH